MTIDLIFFYFPNLTISLRPGEYFPSYFAYDWFKFFMLPNQAFANK